MKERIHGFISIMLVISAFAIGLYAVISHSLAYGIIYAAVMAVSPFIIGYAFCSKCPCRIDSCGHVFVGKITKYVPERKQGAYTMIDYIAVFIPIIVLIAFPQIWLWNNKILFGIFWLFFLIAGVEVIFFVCTRCGNKACAMCRNK
jgi:hypothetical protein